MRALWNRLGVRLGLDELDEERFGPEAARELRAQRIRVVISGSNFNAAGVALVALGLATAFWGQGRDISVAVWLATVLAMCASVYWGGRRSRGRNPSGSRRSVQALTRQSAAMGFVFGLFPFLVMDATEGARTALLVGVMAGAMAGGPSAVHAVPRAAFAWLGIAAAMNALVLTILGGSYALGCLFVLIYALCIGRGILAQARAVMRQFEDTQALGEQREVIELLLKDYENTTSEWRWQTNLEGAFTRIPGPVLELFGWSEAHARGAPAIRLFRENCLDETRDALARMSTIAKANEPFHDIELALTDARDGSKRRIRVRGNPTRDADGTPTGYRGIITDVTEAHAAKERARYLLVHDPLTGLANRSALNDRLGEWVALGMDFAVISLDLDRFKLVNDTMGHPAGDELLRSVAGRLRNLPAPRGTLVARASGDEFFVLCPGSSRDVAALERTVSSLSRRIVRTIAEPYALEAGPAIIGTSVGSALFPRDGTTIEELMVRVDLALYAAKTAGRGTACAYDPSLDEATRRRRGLEADLRHALERGEMSLAFQPIVAIGEAGAEPATRGLEALLRWHHPERGEVPPPEFVRIAEETGLIRPIGEWALREACREAATWRDGLPVTVNASREQLLCPGFTGAVTGALASAGLEPARLELDITEIALNEESGTVRATVTRLRSLGVRIALDDFGRGFNTLCAARETSFDTIKIDRDFVRELGGGGEDARVLIETAMRLAERMGVTAAAEGIERPREAAMLREMGCAVGQGFLFARPVSAEEAAVLAGGRRDGVARPRSDGTDAAVRSIGRGTDRGIDGSPADLTVEDAAAARSPATAA